MTEHAWLVDVRERPKAWSSTWSKPNLQRYCEGVLRVPYMPLKALGNTSGNAVWTPPDIESARAVLAQLAEDIGGNQSVVLMCAELDNTKCHRTKVAEELSKLTGQQVVHIGTEMIQLDRPTKT
jgi:hypothetical protein